MIDRLFRQHLWIGCFCLFFLTACATYYQKLIEFNSTFESGEIEKAKVLLEKDKKGPEGKNRLLYNLNQGTVEWLMGNYAESNKFFNQADLLAEDYQKNAATIALSMVTNPMAQEYRGEDFELVLIHYYKAINYLQLHQLDEAIVECRRLNLKLNQLNDKYGKKNRYAVDAFGLNLMGLVYEASGDYNNAFIAYRNAVEAYENNYASQFGINIPDQLKKDVIQAAHKIGFTEEAVAFEQKFNLKYEPRPKGYGDIIFFWNNGLGPVKAENSINFSVVRGQGGYVTFVNNELGLSFPFFIPSSDNNANNKESALSSLEFIRVAFPKYVERPPYYTSAYITANDNNYNLQYAEDINKIAFKTLEDRMIRELSTSLLRLATKKAAEYAVRDQNKDLGAVVGIVNAITEKADTRNWQTLPHTICYTRMSLPEGQQTVTLNTLSDKNNVKKHPFTFNIQSGKIQFHSYQTLESLNYSNGHR